MMVVRARLGAGEVDALLDGDGPLTVAEREQLELALRWWESQYATARQRVMAITARLATAKR